MKTPNYYKCNSDYVCGIDIHSKMIYICIIDKDDNILKQKSILNKNLNEIEAALKPYIGNIVVGAESCFPYYWLFDFCNRLGVPFVLGHAYYLKHIHGSKTKNDRIDSLKIAKLVKSNLFPMAHCCSKKTRYLRDLLRQRNYLVQIKSGLMTKTRIHGYQSNIDSLGAITNTRILEKVIAKNFKDKNLRLNVESNLLLTFSLDELISEIELRVREQLKIISPTYFKLLNDIRGFDLIIPATIILEIDTIDRFPSVKDFVSYCRLVKCSHESAGKKQGYGNSKIGNPQLRFIFGEAAICLMRFNPEVTKYYEKLVNKYGKGKSLAILAHKIARAIYQVLKTERPFSFEKFLNA